VPIETSKFVNSTIELGAITVKVMFVSTFPIFAVGAGSKVDELWDQKWNSGLGV